MVASLRKNILATLTYYDVLEYPLTAFEVRKYLMNYHNQGEEKKFSYSEVVGKLAELREEGMAKEKSGFWFFPNRESLVAMRIAREKISIAKLKRMRRLVTILRYLPFVRMIAATGSLSLRHGTKGSDWDMLIVLEEKALFTGRFLLTIFLQLIGKRRHGKKIIDRACLNYYTGSQSLTVRLSDWYAAHEYQIMIPLFQTFLPDVFYRANGWLLQFRNHAHLPITRHRLEVSDSAFSKQWRTFTETLLSFSWLERNLAFFQKQKIARNPATHQKGACIIADDHSLVFFPAPRGPKVFEQFQKRLTL